MSDINAQVGEGQAECATVNIIYTSWKVGGTKDGNKDTQGKVQVPLLPGTWRQHKQINPWARLYASTKKARSNYRPTKRTKQPTRTICQCSTIWHGGGVIQPGLYQTPDAVFKVTKRKVQMIRKLQDQSIKIKAVPMFGDSITVIDQNTMSRLFAYGAEKNLQNYHNAP